MTWQPIETAPRDGTRVLMIRAGEQAAWVGSWNLYGTDNGWWDDARELDLKERPPTYWQPLPDPP